MAIPPVGHKNPWSSTVANEVITQTNTNADDIAANATDIDTALSTTGEWTALALSTGWANFGAPYSVLSWRRFGNLIAMRGVIKTTTAITTAVTVTTLPVGARPLETVPFRFDNVARCDLNPSTGVLATLTPINLAAGAPVIVGMVLWSLV